MEVDSLEQRVENILSKKDYSPAFREIIKKRLMESFRDIEGVRESKEDNLYVKNRCPKEFDNKEKKRIEHLQSFSTEFFPESGETELETTETVADVNKRGKWGYTALHFAAIAGDMDKCVHLLSIGADKKILDNGGKMPWEKALSNGHTSLANFLMP